MGAQPQLCYNPICAINDRAINDRPMNDHVIIRLQCNELLIRFALIQKLSFVGHISYCSSILHEPYISDTNKLENTNNNSIQRLCSKNEMSDVWTTSSDRINYKLATRYCLMLGAIVFDRIQSDLKSNNLQIYKLR